VTASVTEASDRQAIAELLVRYASGIDRRDWDLLRSCFTEDCVADYGDIGVWSGAEAITTWMEQAHRECGPTLHRITNPVAEVDGDEAHSRCYVDAIVMGAGDASGVRAVGHYDDELRRTDQGWRISRRGYTMVLLQLGLANDAHA
jgi:3-phenylpropionate/cinnamic acid dioxygenase small subunit